MRVFVYYNLHRKMWSVRAMDGPSKGRVIAHKHTVLLRDAVPKVSEAGRQRVLKEKRKNVHAGIVGTMIESFPGPTRGLRTPITYNPYRGDGFTYSDTGDSYTGSRGALMTRGKVYV